MGPENRCEECGKEILRGYEGVHFGESADSPARFLCIGCYNREMAARAGIDFQHPRFSSVELADAEGNRHLFSFVTRLLGDQVTIEAYEENADPGYQFNVHGRHEEVQRLFHKLKGRIQRALSQVTVFPSITRRGCSPWSITTY